MLRTLLKVRLQAFFASLFRRGTKKSGQRRGITKVLIGLLALYVVGTLFSSMGWLFFSMTPLFSAGYGWLYFTLVGVLAFAISFVTTVFSAQAGIFQAKDNELLLSMPIPVGKILLSRVALMLIMECIYSLLVILPAGVVYVLNVPATATNIVNFVLCSLLLPFFTCALSCLVGGLFAWIDRRLKRKSFLMTGLGVLFMALYFGLISNLNGYIANLTQNPAALAGWAGAFSPVYAFGNAIANGDVLSLGVFALYAITPFALMYWLLERNFLRIVNTRAGVPKARYRAKDIKAGGAYAALVKKELGRFTSSAMYMLNAGVGLVLMVGFAVMLVVRRDMLAAYLPMLGDASEQMLPAIVGAALCMCAGMNCISAPSISLEAKTLWILRSLPISGGDVLTAKADAHMLVCAPFCLVASLVCIIGLDGLSMAAMVALAMLPLAICCFVGHMGVMVNLKFPKLDWVNEVVVIKQSAATMITMFGAMGAVLMFCLLYGVLLMGKLDAPYYMLLCGLALIAGSWLIRGWLKNRGAQALAQLS